MKVNFKELLIHITIWLVAELVLNLTGLNDLSNYSEFMWLQSNLELRRA